jgi:transcription termination/antitermination protein NusG
MNIIEKVNTMKWYVLRSQNNREKSLSEKLIKEGEVGDLMGKIGRVIVPIENSFYLKNGKKVKREKVKFPGYIFIETNAVGELKYFLKGMNGAQGFLTSRAGDILPLTQLEVDRMIGEQQRVKEEVEVDVKYIVGEEVQILDGPFNTFDGKIEQVNGDKVKVAVSVFGRITLIELNINQIDKKV